MKRNKVVIIRLTEEEDLAIRRAAKFYNGGNVSAFLREVGLKKYLKKKAL